MHTSVTASIYKRKVRCQWRDSEHEEQQTQTKQHCQWRDSEREHPPHPPPHPTPPVRQVHEEQTQTKQHCQWRDSEREHPPHPTPPHPTHMPCIKQVQKNKHRGMCKGNVETVKGTDRKCRHRKNDTRARPLIGAVTKNITWPSLKGARMVQKSMSPTMNHILSA